MFSGRMQMVQYWKTNKQKVKKFEGQLDIEGQGQVDKF